MAYLIGLLLGLTTFIWIVSVILTFIGKKFTKKEITLNAIITATIIAGFISLLFGKLGSELFLLIFIIPLVIWGRSKNLKKIVGGGSKKERET